MLKHCVSWIVLFALAAPEVAAKDVDAAPGRLLSAFFGLNDSPRLRLRVLPACRRVAGGDGMPVIFSAEIDERTLSPGDFRIATKSGRIGRVDCVTLQPANEPGERRTVLAIGEFGSLADQPATVEIVGDLMSLDGKRNFKGARVEAIPLENGPTMILAENVSKEDWRLGGRGNCPRERIRNIVRVTWTGGVTKPGGGEIDEKEARLYRVAVRLVDGSVATVTPIAVGDLNDSDNNHELCLGVAGRPLRVWFPAGALTDPREDLNPATEVRVEP